MTIIIYVFASWNIDKNLMNSIFHKGKKNKNLILYFRQNILLEARTLILDFEWSIAMALQLVNALLLSDGPSNNIKEYNR